MRLTTPESSPRRSSKRLGRLAITLGPSDHKRLKRLARGRPRTEYVRAVIADLVEQDPRVRHPQLAALRQPLNAEGQRRLDLRLSADLLGRFQEWCGPGLSTAVAVRAELRLRSGIEPAVAEPDRGASAGQWAPTPPRRGPASLETERDRRVAAARRRIAAMQHLGPGLAPRPPNVERRLARDMDSRRLLRALDEVEGFHWVPAWTADVEIEIADLLAIEGRGPLRLVVGVKVQEDEEDEAETDLESLVDDFADEPTEVSEIENVVVAHGLDDAGGTAEAIEHLLRYVGRECSLKVLSHRFVSDGDLVDVIEVTGHLW